MRKKTLIQAGLSVAAVAVLTVGISLAVERLHPSAPVGKAAFDPALQMTAEIQRIVGTSCADCHSMGTRTPWYASIPPASWLVDSDIRKARAAMNLTDWSRKNGKSPGLAMGTLAAACSVVQAGQMPPSQYKLMHSDAEMNAADQKIFCDWTQQTIMQIAMARRRVVPASATAATPLAGGDKKNIRLMH